MNKFDLPSLSVGNSTKGNLPKLERLSTHYLITKETMATRCVRENLIRSRIRYPKHEHLRESLPQDLLSAYHSFIDCGRELGSIPCIILFTHIDSELFKYGGQVS